MAVIFMDALSYNDTNDADITNYSGMWSAPGNQNAFVTKKPGFTGNAAGSKHQGVSIVAGPYYDIPVGDQTDKIGVGGHFMLQSGTDAGTIAHSVFHFYDGATAQIFVRRTTAGTLAVVPGSFASPGTVLGTSTSTCDIDEWNHIEFAADPSTGYYELRINGVTEVTGTDWTPASAAITRVYLGFYNGGSGSVKYAAYDNFFIWNEAGGVNDDFLGERIIYLLFPDGDEATQDWTQAGAGDFYEELIEMTPSGTKYIESDTEGNVAEFTIGDIPAAAFDVKAVMLVYRANKQASGPSEVTATLTSTNGSDSWVNSTLAEGAYNWFKSDCLNTDFDSNPWTKNAVDNLKLTFTR